MHQTCRTHSSVSPGSQLSLQLCWLLGHITTLSCLGAAVGQSNAPCWLCVLRAEELCLPVSATKFSLFLEVDWVELCSMQC